jgi:predicted TIM-barrel fold metal-dependent hydrolase
LRIAFYYLLMHLAAILDRHHFRVLADGVRRCLPTSRIEHAMSLMLRASCRLVVTHCGGCGIDIDREAEYEAALIRYDEWCETQCKRARSLYGAARTQDGRTSA